MLFADSHTHSEFSPDSPAPLETMVEKAIQLGLKYYTITDHCDFNYPLPGLENAFVLDKSKYMPVVREAQAKYKGQIELLLGVEIGLAASQKVALENYVKDEPFDFIIGSTHIAYGRDPYQSNYFDGRTEQEGYADYFRAVAENAAAIKCFNIYGHMDYVIRYGATRDTQFNPEDYREFFDPALKKIISSGKGIEINTAGLGYGLRHAHPHPWVVKRYRELGGELVTVGSDAHRPEHIARYFDQIQELLISLGFKYYAVFKEQKPIYLPL